MQKRTIKPAAGQSRVSPADAQRAAWHVRRDSAGRVILSKDGLPSTKRPSPAKKR